MRERLYTPTRNAAITQRNGNRQSQHQNRSGNRDLLMHRLKLDRFIKVAVAIGFYLYDTVADNKWPSG